MYNDDLISRLQMLASLMGDPRPRATVHDAVAEIERLTKALTVANSQAERFEREWYLRGDALEKLQQYVPHAYEGDCPDELDRTRRDRNCPACRLLGEA